jgi:hypothetical protein
MGSAIETLYHKTKSRLLQGSFVCSVCAIPYQSTCGNCPRGIDATAIASATSTPPASTGTLNIVNASIKLKTIASMATMAQATGSSCPAPARSFCTVVITSKMLLHVKPSQGHKANPAARGGLQVACLLCLSRL